MTHRDSILSRVAIGLLCAGLLIGLLGIPGLFSPSAKSSGSNRPPNILFILTDDLDLHELEVMPKLKSLLIDQGVSFAQYFANVSLCCPSRVTTLSGQYAHNTHVLTNGGTNGGFETFHERNGEQSTLATWLQAQGYRTALIGKYLNGYPNTVGLRYVPPGWTEWASPSAGDPYSEFNYTLNKNGKLSKFKQRETDYGTDVFAHKTKEFMLKAIADQVPFFAFLSVVAPHFPATPAPRHQMLFADAKAPRTPAFNEADVSDKPAFIQQKPPLKPRAAQWIDRFYRLRIQSLQAVDEAIANLYETLEAANQLDNTYIVFSSDNGFHLGQHRLHSGKETAYEEDIHLPLVVKGPGVPRGKTVAAISGNVDLAPTFADLAGVKPPASVDGRSLVPLFQPTRTMPSAWRQVYLLGHWVEADPETRNRNLNDRTLEPPDRDQFREEPVPEILVTPPHKAGKSVIPAYQGLRTQRYTYVEYETGERELYDLEQDPDQLQNLAQSAPSDQLQRFAERLAQLRTCVAEACRRIEEQPFSG
ncbi:MAG TPA: sulfatase [Coleofasciculaceae cyanobacterium]